jgi:integrase
MATTRLFLDTRVSSGKNPSVLKIAIAHKGKTTYISLDAKLTENQWDSLREKVVNHPDRLVLNTYISKIKSLVDSTIINLTNDCIINKITVQEIKERCLDALHPERKQEKLEATFFLARFDKYASRTKRGTRRTFDHTRERLIKFVGSESKLKQLRFEDITYDWLCDFDDFMAKTAPSVNSRNVHYRNMRTVFNAAIDDNITSNYPFRRFKIKNEETAKRDLKVEELRQLFFFKCEEHANRYLDIFKLSFFLMGVNTVDICNLDGEDYSRDRLQFHRTKTRHFYSKFVEPEAQQIIEKYRGKKYLINVMDHWSSDEYFRKKMNKVLQRIGPVKRSGLGGKKEYSPLFSTVTSYYARHTWASIASSIDIPNEVIAEGLGHEYGNRITNIYINFDIKKVDRANRKILDWVLYGKLNGEQVVAPGTPEFFGLTARQMKKLGMESAI